MKQISFCVLYFLFLKNATALLYEGQQCTVHQSNDKGQCISIDQCQYAQELIKNRKSLPPVCGFRQNEPLVCCPFSRKSIKKCTGFYTAKHLKFAIAVGKLALPREFPHMAAVGYGQKDDIQWLCGGSLISEKFVLTAAHCVQSRDFGAAKWVRLGDLDLKSTTEDAAPVDIAIEESFKHPNYKFPSHYHDIALFKLERSAGFRFKPACLHTDYTIPVPTLQATGWGKVDFFGDSSSHLMKVDLNVIDHPRCAARYHNAINEKLAQGILDKFQICAGHVSGGDTCPGDSGGPLHYRDKGTKEILSHFVLVGVTSFGRGCGTPNSTGVYTRVASYIDWIENIVWP